MPRPFAIDNDTIALYHFDEGHGNEARSACGDPSLTLRAKAAQWGERPGGGAVARFERCTDDATVFAGPVNHDKLHLRTCPEAWTVEAWLRFAGNPAGDNPTGHNYVNICGNDDEGFSLNGLRGGWILALTTGVGWHKKDYGLAPGARFEGGLRGRDPTHDTSGTLFACGEGWLGAPTDAFIRDAQWHHVAWQFRFADQTHFFFIDKRLVWRIQLPLPCFPLRDVVNDSERVGVPFTVGGFVHSQNPPYFLGHGNFEGEIAEVRISRVLRYPVAERLSIVKRRGRVAENTANIRRALARELQAGRIGWKNDRFEVKHQGRVADGLALVAGQGVPFEITFEADAARGAVKWAIVEGELPAGLALDPNTGRVSGRADTVCAPQEIALQARDDAGDTDRHSVAFEVRPGRIATAALPSAFAGRAYEASLAVEHLAAPLKWKLVDGGLPDGLCLDADCGTMRGTPAGAAASTHTTIRVRATDARGVGVEQDLAISVLPVTLADIGPDGHTVFLYDWQGEKARLIPDVMGDETLALDWVNMGGDRRVAWPGRAGCFPQETGHGEHGFVSLAKNHDKHNLRACPDEWTVEAWVRRGGPDLCWGEGKPFNYGHICGTYDTTEQGVWELYLSDRDSPDGSMAPGVHFFGAEPGQALKDLHPWKRSAGIVGDPADAGIRDTEWHHVAWQYNAVEDLHQLFLDGRLIWRMRSPDGRRLVNNRQHPAQFSVFTRIDGFVIRGHGEDGAFGAKINYSGWGNFFGQIGEIRVSDVRRYVGE